MELNEKGEHSVKLFSEWGFNKPREKINGKWQDLEGKPWEVKVKADDTLGKLVEVQEAAFEKYLEAGDEFKKGVREKRPLIDSEGEMKIKIHIDKPGTTDNTCVMSIYCVKKFWDEKESKYTWEPEEYRNACSFFCKEYFTEADGCDKTNKMCNDALKAYMCSFYMTGIIEFYGYVNKDSYGLVARAKALYVTFPDCEPPEEMIISEPSVKKPRVE